MVNTRALTTANTYNKDKNTPAPSKTASQKLAEMMQYVAGEQGSGQATQNSGQMNTYKGENSVKLHTYEEGDHHKINPMKPTILSQYGTSPYKVENTTLSNPDTKDDSGSGGTKKTTVTFKTGSYSGGGDVSTPAVTEPVAPAEPDTTVQDAYTERMNAANERLKQAYEFQQAQLQRAKDDAFREAYIKQQMVERGYPEQLAAAGIRGGAAQGVIARNNADYAKQRSGIYNNYLTNMANAGQTYQQGLMQNEEDFLASMAAYEQLLKQMEIQHQYDKELAQLKASLAT